MQENNRWLGRVGMQFTFSRVLEYYLTTLELEGKSRKTIEWYRQKLEAFHQFLAESNGQVLARDLSLDEGRAFVKSLMDRKTIYEDHPSK